MKYITSIVFAVAALLPFQSAAVNGETMEFIDTDFLLLTEEDERSELNDYVLPQLKKFERDGRAYAWFEWLEPAALVHLKVQEQEKWIEPEVIVSTNKRHVVELRMEPAPLLEIEVKQGQSADAKKHIVRVEAEVEKEQPVLEAPVASKAVSSMPRRSETAAPPAAGQKKEVPKKEILKPEQEQLPNEQPAPPEREEKPLRFDRSEDAPKDTTPPVPAAPPAEQQPAQKVAAAPEPEDAPVLTLDLLKVWGLFALCALSGVLLLRRLFGNKKAVK